MAVNDQFLTLPFVLFSLLYPTLFILSTVGNTWIIITCYKTLRTRYAPFLWLLANLATADLSFTFLSLFNGVGYLWQWVGGNASCKLQGFLLEASYTTSIITLVLISYQRLKAVTDPLNDRIGYWSNREHIRLVIVWCLSLAVCSPLTYIYRVKTEEDGDIVCLTTTRGNSVPQIYYSLHATFFFLIPLLYTIFTQVRIFHTLRSSVIPNSNLFNLITKSNQRHRKVAKTLAALTIAFVFCWSPFVITRTLIYFRLASLGLFWRVSQLLIFVNAVLDPLLYGYYGGNLKSTLRRVLPRQ